MIIRRPLALLLAVAVAATAGCGSSSSSTPAPAGGGEQKSVGKTNRKLDPPPPIQPIGK